MSAMNATNARPLAEPRMRYARGSMAALPEKLRWIFWDVDFDSLDPVKDADAILPRVLELGRLDDVRTILAIYGTARIHRFFRDIAHPLISDRTRAFWRAFFDAEDESWATPPTFRTNNAGPWTG